MNRWSKNCVLNRVFEQLQVQQSSLEEAELKYRTLFEQAVEGIFQTSADGEILTANNALAFSPPDMR